MYCAEYMFLGMVDRHGNSALSACAGSAPGVGGITRITGELSRGNIKNAGHNAALGNRAFAFCLPLVHLWGVRLASIVPRSRNAHPRIIETI